MRIAIAGSGRLGVSLLAPLLDSAHEIIAVIQDGRKMRGWRQRLRTWNAAFSARPNDLLCEARRLRAPIVWLDKMTHEELDPLRALHPDLVLVSGFGLIFKKPLLELPRIGCVNLHSSLLPRHRGPNPFAAVILAGETVSGITFHLMDEGIDTGDILEQQTFSLRPDDTALAVYRRACETAAGRVVAVMDRIAREGLHGIPQDPAAAIYDKRPTAEDARIRWEEPVEIISRQVRALAPGLLPHFRYRGRTIHVLRVQCDPSPAPAEPGTVIENRPCVTVATGRGTVRLLAAVAGTPLPWPWPAPWSCPQVGESLLAGAEPGLLS